MNQEQWRVVKNTALIISVDVNGKALPNLATDAFPEDVRDVTLRECALDEDFCKSLSQFSSLGRLTLSNCNLDMDSVEALNQLKRVSSIPIDFTDTKVDADSISALSKLKRVRAITMKNATVSPAALARFATLPPISSLKLASMLIDDKFFESVGRMKRLTLLQLNGCKFDGEAFKQLESTGRVRIEFQPRAFLGVGPVAAGRPGSMGCQIAYIAPNSAAAGNGIQVGDVIRAIDGDEVRTFKEVRLKIAQYDPGEKMSMEIQRAGKTLELNIELGKNNPVDR
jgi:hypothetical protein